jgi:DNA polymerase III epsilon subunit-like protein
MNEDLIDFDIIFHRIDLKVQLSIFRNTYSPYITISNLYDFIQKFRDYFNALLSEMIEIKGNIEPRRRAIIEKLSPDFIKYCSKSFKELDGLISSSPFCSLEACMKYYSAEDRSVEMMGRYRKSESYLDLRNKYFKFTNMKNLIKYLILEHFRNAFSCSKDDYYYITQSYLTNNLKSLQFRVNRSFKILIASFPNLCSYMFEKLLNGKINGLKGFNINKVIPIYKFESFLRGYIRGNNAEIINPLYQVLKLRIKDSEFDVFRVMKCADLELISVFGRFIAMREFKNGENLFEIFKNDRLEQSLKLFCLNSENPKKIMSIEGFKESNYEDLKQYLPNEKVMENKILIIDLETTGLVADSEFIVEVGICILDITNGNIDKVLDTFVRDEGFSEKSSDRGVFELSDIKYDDVINAPSLNSFLLKIQKLLSDYEFTSFNLSFEKRFLNSREIKVKYPGHCIMQTSKGILNISHDYYGVKIPSLNEALDFYGIEFNGKPHRAYVDCEAEAKLLYEMIKKGDFRPKYCVTKYDENDS